MVNAKFGTKSLSKRSTNSVSEEETYQPQFELPQASSRDYHLLIVYDVDAPYPPPRDTKSPQVHYLVSNIQSKDLSSGNVLLPYAPFDIPAGSEPHTVYVEVYRQGQGYIRPSPHRSRTNFKLRQFIERHDLELVDRRVTQVHSSKDSDELFRTGSFSLKKEVSSPRRTKSPKRSSRSKKVENRDYYPGLYTGIASGPITTTYYPSRTTTTYYPGVEAIIPAAPIATTATLVGPRVVVPTTTTVTSLPSSATIYGAPAVETITRF